MSEIDRLMARIAELERENRTLRLENAQIQMAMERSTLYNLSKDRLIEAITTEKSKQELEAVNAAMKELTANISHDLKTPLSVMSVHLEELSDLARAAGNEEAYGRVAAAWRKNLELQRITQNLLEVNRIESGRSLHRPRWFPLSELMAQAQDKYEDFLSDKGLYLDTRYGEDAELWLDANKIWSVFDNVLYNAARHTSAGGVSIVAETRTKTAKVTVKDTGEGIAPADLPHIFERFYKGGGAEGAIAGDSGLGLYIVRSTMEAIDGCVAAESELGRGTSIVLTFKKRG